MNDTINDKKAINFNDKGKFLPGNKIGNLPKKKAYNVNELKKAIEEVEKGKKSTLLKHFIKKAYTSNQVLIALIKKLVPDISISELKSSEPFNLFVMQFLKEKEIKEYDTLDGKKPKS